MNHQELSQRLAKVGEFIPDGSRLADIGSDHAYLPVALMLKGRLAYAVAGEVVAGPFRSAEKQVAKHGLSEKIKVRLADGLAAVEAADHIDAVTICGMGGGLIRDILETGRQEKRISLQELLILQPNVGEALVRRWLQDNGYCIRQEAILEENQKIYEIIVAQPAAKPAAYSEAELYFGPELLREKSAVFRKKWQRELQQKQRVIQQLQSAQTPQKAKIAAFKKEAALIEEVLTEA